MIDKEISEQISHNIVYPINDVIMDYWILLLCGLSENARTV